MKDYASMSDFEINSAVSMLTLGKSGKPRSRYVVINDYCNNPADAWPILLENEISLVKWKHDDVWAAWAGAEMNYGEVEFEHAEHDENPLRCAMIVFLMMKESENA